jgi:CRISPR system Cascade subunit CasE
MAVDVAVLNMVRIRFNPRGLVELGRRRRLPVRDLDTGYLVHCGLGELFGDRAPKPFAVTSTRQGWVEVLAYSDFEADELRSHAGSYSAEGIRAIVDLPGLASRRMPDVWEQGARFGFTTRVCPVVRAGHGSRRYKAGAEVDAFLAHCTAVGDDVPVTREAVYREWFVAALLRIGGASPADLSIESFQLERLMRRNHDDQRRSTIRTRPDIVVTGSLEVTDRVAFAELVRRGVGRHRAFGFGMLLLRPLG